MSEIFEIEFNLDQEQVTSGMAAFRSIENGDLLHVKMYSLSRSVAAVSLLSDLVLSQDENFERARLRTLWAGKLSSKFSSSMHRTSNATNNTTTGERLLTSVELTACSVVVQIRARRSGTFRFVVDDADMQRQHAVQIVVLPRVSYNDGGKSSSSLLRVSDLVVQTLVTKNLSTLRETLTNGVLCDARLLGFNAVHFTPFEKLGRSRSAYSLASQSDYEPSLFAADDADGASVESRARAVESFVRRLESEFRLLSFGDIVLNHTADNSDWLADHPEATYTLENSPHLRLAHELDQAMLRFSSHIAKEKRSKIDSVATADSLVNEFFDKVNGMSWFCTQLYIYVY